MPLLCDVKIFHAIQKLLYSQVMADFDVHAFLSNNPLLFGMWHLFKHCLTMM